MTTVSFSYLSRRFTAPAERNVRWPGRMFPGPSCKVKSLRSWERRWTTNRSQKSGKLEKYFHSVPSYTPYFELSFLLVPPYSFMISEWNFLWPDWEVLIYFFPISFFFFFFSNKYPMWIMPGVFLHRHTHTKAKTQGRHVTHTHYMGEIFSFPDCWFDDFFCPFFK